MLKLELRKSHMSIEAYLHRIGFDGDRAATPETLRRLHRAHLFAVPFENLDITLGRPLSLTLPALHAKIVTRRRGGFCYELNGLFAWLLRELGFGVELLAARVHGEGGVGPEFDHLLLRVDGERIADVGFGDSFVEPLLFGPDVQEESGHAYRFVRAGSAHVLERREPGGSWQPQYEFSLTSRELADFEPMCRYHETSPESTFTRKTVCSRATAEGRVTFADGRFIVTRGSEREERSIDDANELSALLEQYFDVALEGPKDFERLLRG